MKKSTNTDVYGYDSTFPTILRELLMDTTQEKLASYCGVQRQSIAQWKDGKTKPDIVSLKRIAEFFNVSTDYLLGLTECPTSDKDEAFICEYTGLSADAVNKLNFILDLHYDMQNGTNDYYKRKGEIITNFNFLNYLICDENFIALLYTISDYLYSYARCEYIKNTYPNLDYRPLEERVVTALFDEGVFQRTIDEMEIVDNDFLYEKNEKQPMYLYKIQKSFMDAVESYAEQYKTNFEYIVDNKDGDNNG